MHGADEPVAILFAERPIEAVPRPRFFDRFAARVGAKRLRHVVARRQLREQERRRRHGKHQHDSKGETARDVADHLPVTVNVSGDHSSWGGVTDGVTLPTRVELPTNTRGATK